MESEFQLSLQLLVRLATIADLETIVRFYSEMWQIAYGTIIDKSFLVRFATNPVHRGYFASLLALWRSDIKMLLAFEGERLVGLAIGGPYRDAINPGHFENYALYVHPDYQGKGLGHYLWCQRAHLLHENGAKILHTWVLEDNSKAREIYEQWGGLTAEPRLREVRFEGQVLREAHYIWDLDDPKIQEALKRIPKQIE